MLIIIRLHPVVFLVVVVLVVLIIIVVIVVIIFIVLVDELRFGVLLREQIPLGAAYLLILIHPIL